VLLRGLTITPIRARYHDFDLALDDEVEVNPVLLHKLASVFGAVIEKPSQERIAADLGATLDLAEHATAPDTTALHRRLTDRQQRLRRHAAALHRVHEPWRLSAYQVQSALLGVPAAARVSARLAAPEAITPGSAPRSALAPRRMRPLSSP
jgi:hypothetical protein